MVVGPWRFRRPKGFDTRSGDGAFKLFDQLSGFVGKPCPGGRHRIAEDPLEDLGNDLSPSCIDQTQNVARRGDRTFQGEGFQRGDADAVAVQRKGKTAGGRDANALPGETAGTDIDGNAGDVLSIRSGFAQNAIDDIEEDFRMPPPDVAPFGHEISGTLSRAIQDSSGTEAA